MNVARRREFPGAAAQDLSKQGMLNTARDAAPLELASLAKERCGFYFSSVKLNPSSDKRLGEHGCIEAIRCTPSLGQP
jgi:hypothetical protein